MKDQQPAVKTDDTPCTSGHDHGIVHDLVAGITDPHELAVLIHSSPWLDAEIVRYLRDHRSAAYVDEVMAELVKVQQGTANAKTDHASAIPWRDQLASGAGDVHSGAPDPSRPLPFDKTGGWDAVAINKQLGQYDRLTETDSDGDRCAFATALAAQVFLGPAAMIAWLEGFIAEHAGPKAKFDRVDAGAAVIRTVSKAIATRTATFGDLSWLQESLHGIAVKDGDGVDDASDAVVYARESYEQKSDPLAADPATQRGQEVASPADLVAQAEALAPGSRLMLLLVGVRPGGTKAIAHQFMIMNHGGKRYLYDPEETGYDHCRVATAEALAGYYPGGEYAAAHVYVQGVAAVKPPPTKAKKAKAA